MSDKEHKADAKRKKLEEMIKKEAKKDLKPRMGEIRELEAKSKSKKSKD